MTKSEIYPRKVNKDSKGLFVYFGGYRIRPQIKDSFAKFGIDIKMKKTKCKYYSIMGDGKYFFRESNRVWWVTYNNKKEKWETII